MPSRNQLLRRIALCIALLPCGMGVAVGQQGQAQPTADSVSAPFGLDQCQAAASILKLRPSHPRHGWAVRQIRFCPEEGSAFYADLWRTVEADTSALRDLIFYSPRLRDARVFEAASGAALDRSRPPAVRIGAMLVLSKYVDPASAIWLTDLVPPDSIRRIPLILSSTTAGEWRAGSHPVADNVGPAVLTMLETIANNRAAEPRAVWYAAAVLAKRVRVDVERSIAK
jgi:hypothetical protein